MFSFASSGKIPDEAKALSLLAPAPTMTSLMPGAGLLPIPTPTPLATLGVSLGTLGTIPAAALDSNITALGEIPQPPIMGNVDPSKIDEIRRTVYVGNLNSQTTTADQLLEFFKQVGEVKFVRMAGDETQPTRFAFVEFADQNSVPRALAFNGVMFGDRPLKINHSNNAIVKPPEMTPQAAAKELEEVMKRVREAQSFISAAIEPESGKSNERKGGRTRSHSRSESRYSSKSQSRRKRSHSKHRSRSGNRSLSRHKDRCRSRSPLKKRSRSRERWKSRSCSHSR
ncbi:PREDICTED: splicing regulatory glutamine/lysine-rich protein 1-like, partial [Mesitornis unicolor]|uniref:splicing regulatory glutamine/lysine-rich protein 1-like n=1 Tax=Mesitornis unicolor TaxID=54374 RepID=UPI0005293146